MIMMLRVLKGMNLVLSHVVVTLMLSLLKLLVDIHKQTAAALRQ